MTSKLAQKMKSNLQALEAAKADQIHSAAQAEQAAKVEAARAKGPTAEQKRNSAIKQAIFKHMQGLPMGKHVKFVPIEFVETKMNIEDGRPQFSWFGWREAQLVTPQGIYLRYDIKHEYSQDGYRWSSRQNGKVRIYTGDYGNKSVFKQMKDGGHRYSDIARELDHQIASQYAAARAELLRRSNLDAVQLVISSLDVEYKTYNGVRLDACASKETPVTVRIDTTKNLTVDQATELLNVLKKFNIG